MDQMNASGPSTSLKVPRSGASRELLRLEAEGLARLALLREVQGLRHFA
jgi:hypothetical protein